MSKSEITKKVATLLESFDLIDKSNVMPFDLSVGQQQKVAIARAIVNNPTVILADEPSGEMDPMAGEEIVAKMVELNRKSNVTTIVASHGMFFCNHANRTVFLRDWEDCLAKRSGILDCYTSRICLYSKRLLILFKFCLSKMPLPIFDWVKHRKYNLFREISEADTFEF